MALILVSAILLISDLQNRNKTDDHQSISNQDNPGASVLAKYKLALVAYNDSPNSEDCEKGIRQALRDKNLKENIDYTLKTYNAQGDVSTLNSIAGSLANEKWDLIFGTSTPTIQLLSKKLPGMRIAFTNVGDPQAAGLGVSFDEHLPNLCGVSTMSDFDGLLKLVCDLHPGLKKAGTVFTPGEINSISYKNRLGEAAKNRGIELVAVPANSATEILDAANSLVAQRIEVFCQISDNLTASCSSAILKVSKDSKIPYYGFITNQVEQGAIAVCARDYFQAGYETGEMGLLVLGGKNPSDIPYRYVRRTEYLINLETAKLYKVAVPQRVFTDFPELKTRN